MNRLQEILYKWLTECKKPITMTPYDMDVLYGVLTGQYKSFINGNVKALCDKYHVPTWADGIGWRLM